MMKRILLCAVLVAAAVSADASRRRAVAPVDDDQQRLLLPIYGFQPNLPVGFGPFFIAHNAGSKHVAIEGVGALCSFDPCLEPNPPKLGISPGGTRVANPSSGPPGRFVFVPSDAQLEFNLEILTPTSLRPPIQVPVVRDRDFRQGTAMLLPVLAGRAFRNSLRVYSETSETFTIRFFLIGEVTDTLLAQSSVATSGPFSRYAPYYAEITDFPVAPNGATSGLRIEVTPVKPGTRFWCMATVFGVETQTLALVTPQ